MKRDRAVIVGDLMFDVVVTMPGELNVGSDLPSEISTTFGGTGGNVAAWTAQAGVQPDVVGVVGADHWGDLMLRHLVDLGIRTHVRQHPTLPTGVVVALVHPSGERTMLPDSRANAALLVDDFADCNWARTAWLYMSAYTLMNPATAELAEQVMREAKAAGVQILLDPASAAPLAQVSLQRRRGWLQLADVLVPNELELLVLTGGKPADTLLADCAAIVVKRGRAGVEILQRGESAISVPAAPTHMVDTVGAGDGFAGGLLAALMQGKGLVESAEVGVQSAARAVSVRGAQPDRIID